MKYFLVTINVLLIAAVGYLYYIHYNQAYDKPEKVTVEKKENPLDFKIAYFDLDSLENNYEYFKTQRNYLKARNDEVEKKLLRMQNDYMAKVNDFNKRGPNLSQAEQLQYQEQLMKMSRDYQEQEQKLSQDLQAETMKRMIDVKTKIQDFLKNYGKEKGYTYVFATNSEDNFIYFKDTVRNITNDIVTQLNLQNEASKNK